MGSWEVIFGVQANFAKGIKDKTRYELVVRKCKMFNMDEGTWMDCNKRGLIPQELEHMEER